MAASSAPRIRSRTVALSPMRAAALVPVVRRLRVAQQPGQCPREYPVLRVLEGQPGVPDRLAQLVQRWRLRRYLEDRADLVVALQGRPDLLDLDLVDAVDVAGP